MYKNRIIRTLALLLSLLSLLALSACKSATNYKTDVSTEFLSKNIEQVVKLEDEAQAFKNVGKMSLTTSAGLGDLIAENKSQDYVVRNTAGKTSDEYGVLRFADGAAAKEALAAIKTYLAARAADTTQRSYYDDDYKLDESEARQFGNYVAYAILSKANRSAFFSQIEALLENN